MPPPVRPRPRTLLHQAGSFLGRPNQIDMPGVELEQLTDYDQHLFIERGLHGGISMVSKRHAKANNHLVDGFDPEKPCSHIFYLDANNLLVGS